MVTRISEAMQRKQIFLVCRYVLILSTGAVAVSEVGKQAPHWPIALLIVLALSSNLVLGQVEPFGFFDPWLQAPLIVSDTSMISMALLLSRASQESFLFFFFVLIMAAKLENLATLGICAGIIGFASFLDGRRRGGLGVACVDACTVHVRHRGVLRLRRASRAQRRNAALLSPARTGN